jgi:2-polyprenyl-6-methoxyphenol hydroxylase-like FAD-dependent oxidoreductase
VEARQQAAVQKVAGRGPFFVTTSTGHFETRAVVNASGRWSNLSAPATNGNTTEKWIGLKAHFAEASPAASVDLYFFDGGYCGVQPVTLRGDSGQPRVNACAMVRADVASTLPDVFQLHPALRQRAAPWQPLKDPVSVAPLFFGTPQPVREGIFMVGDAAGFVDPFIGDGISLALRGGALAAECLRPFFGDVVSLEHAVHRYAEEYQQQLAPVFRSSATIRRMLLLPQLVRRPITSLLANSPAVTRYLVRKTR